MTCGQQEASSVAADALSEMRSELWKGTVPSGAISVPSKLRAKGSSASKCDAFACLWHNTFLDPAGAQRHPVHAACHHPI